jgi:CxxC-x17-CxxC domain-containing protein
VLPLSRTETRTRCSACDIETTVPFKPTQGRPVLCRSCFELKRVPTAVAAVATMDSAAARVAAAAEALGLDDASLAASAREPSMESLGSLDLLQAAVMEDSATAAAAELQPALVDPAAN